MKIMIVEDEKDIRDILRSLLEDSGFQVVALDNGAQISEQLKAHRPALLLLDQVLPGKSGVDLVREVRSNRDFVRLPIMMVTGLSGEEDKVVALDYGADDYVTKPFYPKELVSRIRALIRRVDSNEELQEQKISCDSLTIDFSAHRVMLENREIALTLTEFKILGELLKQSGQVLTRERLRERALGNLNVTDRTIDVHMASLRKKLEPWGDRIETVRGVGYRYALA